MARRVIGWESDRYTGEFPVTRIIWGCLWLPFLYASMLLFVGTVGMMSGYDAMVRAWKQAQTW